jgi:hypothetical protein
VVVQGVLWLLMEQENCEWIAWRVNEAGVEQFIGLAELACINCSSLSGFQVDCGQRWQSTKRRCQAPTLPARGAAGRAVQRISIESSGSD